MMTGPLARGLMLAAAGTALAFATALAVEPPQPQQPASKAVNVLAGTRPEPENMGDVFGAKLSGWTDVDQMFELRRRPRFYEGLQYDLGIRGGPLAKWLEQDIAALYRRENPSRKPDFAFLFGGHGYGGYVSTTMGQWFAGKLPGVELEKKAIGLALERLAGERPECAELASGLQAQFDDLCRQNPGPDDHRWWEFYARINRLREATAGLGVIGTLPASAQTLKDLFGGEFSSPPDLEKRTEQLLSRIKDATGDLTGNGVRKISDDALALRREVWLGLTPLRQYLDAHKDLDLATEWQQQNVALYDNLSEREWFAKVAGQTFRRESLIQDGDRDPTDIVLRRTGALLKEIQAIAGAKPAELTGLAQRLAKVQEVAAKVPVGHVDARYALYFETCRLRRQVAFVNPLLDFNQVLFIKRQFMPGEVNYPFFISQGWCAMGGGGLFVLEDPFSPHARPRDLLASAKCDNGSAKDTNLAGGAFIGPELSFDARRILFSWTAVPK